MSYEHIYIIASGKRLRESVAFEILAIFRYDASKTSPTHSGWVAAVVCGYVGMWYVGTIMHVYP